MSLETYGRPLPPFVQIDGEMWLIQNWNETLEDVPGDEPIKMRRLSSAEIELYRRLTREAEMEVRAWIDNTPVAKAG